MPSKLKLFWENSKRNQLTALLASSCVFSMKNNWLCNISENVLWSQGSLEWNDKGHQYYLKKLICNINGEKKNCNNNVFYTLSMFIVEGNPKAPFLIATGLWV